MAPEARLEGVPAGLAPASPGWFVVNVRDAAWRTNEAFGARCVFELDGRIARERPELAEQRFDGAGVTLAVLEPGRPNALYHAESAQEGFLVLAGECVALVEDEEVALGPWDFLHCAPGTAHVLVAPGERPCVVLMLGARPEGRTIVYPRSERALALGAGVEAETDSPREAYAAFPHWRLARPAGERELPWGV